MRIIRRAGVLLVVLMIAACARVESHVTRFHSLPAKGTGQTFCILPLKDQKDSLEFKQYAAEVRAKLVAYGFTPVSESDDPQYAVLLAYGISNGKTVSGTMPIYGQTGGGTTYHSGTISSPYGGYGSYSGTSYTPPTFGQVGSIPYTKTFYTRWLLLHIYDFHKSTKKKLHEVYEGKVISTGESSSFSTVSTCVIDALFKDFPGISGKTSDVVTASDSCVK